MQELPFPLFPASNEDVKSRAIWQLCYHKEKAKSVVSDTTKLLYLYQEMPAF